MLKIGSRIKFVSEDITYWFYVDCWKENNFNSKKKSMVVDLQPSIIISIDTLKNNQNFIVGLLHHKEGIFYLEIDKNFNIVNSNYTIKIL